MKHVTLAAFAIQNEDGKWLLQKRPSTGLLAGLWEFPMIELQETSAVETFEKENGLKLKNLQKLPHVLHVFSHITWNIHVYRARLEEEHPDGDLQFFTKVEVEALPKSKPVLKIIDLLEW